MQLDLALLLCTGFPLDRGVCKDFAACGDLDSVHRVSATYVVLCLDL